MIGVEGDTDLLASEELVKHREEVAAESFLDYKQARESAWIQQEQQREERRKYDAEAAYVAWRKNGFPECPWNRVIPSMCMHPVLLTASCNCSQ